MPVHPSAPAARAKAAEPADLDFVAALERLNDAVEDRLHDGFRLFARQFRHAQELLHQVRFRHRRIFGHVSPALARLYENKAARNSALPGRANGAGTRPPSGPSIPLNQPEGKMKFASARHASGSNHMNAAGHAIRYYSDSRFERMASPMVAVAEDLDDLY